MFKAAGGDLNELLAFHKCSCNNARKWKVLQRVCVLFSLVFNALRLLSFLNSLVLVTDLNGKFVGPFEAVKQLSVLIWTW